MLNNEHKSLINGILSRVDKTIKDFYKNKTSLVLEIYQSLSDPSYKIEGRKEPIDFKVFKSYKTCKENSDKLLPLTTRLDLELHKDAYSIWALTQGLEDEVSGFGFMHRQDEETSKDLQARIISNEKIDEYYKKISPAVGEYSKNWVKNKIDELKKSKDETSLIIPASLAQSCENNINQNSKNNSSSTSPVISGISTTTPNTPTSPKSSDTPPSLSSPKDKKFTDLISDPNASQRSII